ncbi:MAG TPA: efflux RND transporter periplasmic adaptor subunit [Cyclobacteriaceae bacterium]|nr:efflux RND transporter periplasmic adaptor subunit [Cyclobacteriaceae bacterium]
MKNNKRIQSLSITSMLALIIFFACSKKEGTDTPTVQPPPSTPDNIVSFTDEQYKTVGIELGKITERQLSGTINVTGMLDVPPQNVVNITAPFGGFLRSTPLLQGMHVVKGQSIAVIENPEYIQLQQDFLDTKSQVKFLEAENLRQEELAKENVNSQKTLQKSRADLESMKAKNIGLLAKLKMLNIDADKLGPGAIRSTIELHSPINGYVTQINSTIGGFVNPTDVMFRIVDTEHLHAEITAFERDIPNIRIGQKIRFTLANESKERTAKVFLIGKEISADRTVRIHGHLDQEDLNLIPGMYLKAQIETSDRALPSLPEAAVVNFEDKNYVFVKISGEENQFKMIEVNTGTRDGGFIEVALPENFDLGNEIVIRGAYNLLSKMKNNSIEE